MGVCCCGVGVCEGTFCSTGFLRLGSSGSVSLSSDSKFDFRGSAVGLDAGGVGAEDATCIGGWLAGGNAWGCVCSCWGCCGC
jgi:hypothetical protein